MIPYKYGAGLESQVEIVFDLGTSICKLVKKVGRVLRTRKNDKS